jgi:hemolysin activation/secretion protein
MRRYLVISSLLFSLALSPVNGQTNQTYLSPNRTSGAELNRILEQLQKNRLERRLKREAEEVSKKEEKKEAPSPKKEPKLPKVSLHLKKVEFSDSTVISKEKLQEISSQYVGKKVDMAQLYAMIKEVNKIYKDNGYITAMAVLPPQKIKDGVIKVTLIEGKVGNVVIAGNKTTDSNYLRDRVYLPEGHILSVNRLNDDLQWFNGTNDVKLRIKLQAGKKPGTTDYYLFAYEPKVDSARIFCDTAGSDGTGRTRTGITYTHSSVSGTRDVISATLLKTKGSLSGILNYSVPINSKGMRLGLYHSSNSLTTLKGLTIKGKSNTVGVSLSIPQVVTSKRKEELIFDIHKQRATNRVFGRDFVDDDENRYSIAKTFYRYSKTSALYLKPSYTYCHYEGLNQTKDIKKFNIDGIWQKKLNKNHYLNLKINGQRTDNKFLPSADLFYLGGVYSIRGYNESVLGGDSGLSIKLDYLCPSPISKNTQFFVFYDWGKIYGKSLLDQRILNSAGFGLNHTFVNNSYVSLTIGYPFVGQIGQNIIAPQKVDLALNIVF